MSRTLVVTNDYPPRPGGIQAFVQAMVDGFTPSDVVVYASTWRGKAEECRRYDDEKPYLTVRDRTTMMIPDPKRVRRAVEIAKAEGCDRVWFGAAAQGRGGTAGRHHARARGRLGAAPGVPAAAAPDR
jgi:phosphatidylinositol alpha-1,6-mannosyltransferase